MGELRMILEGLGFGFGISTWPELPASAGPEDPLTSSFHPYRHMSDRWHLHRNTVSVIVAYVPGSYDANANVSGLC